MKPFSSFAEHPSDVRFETQEREETVELFVRQHPVVNIPWMVVGVLMILAPLLLPTVTAALIPLSVTIPTPYLVVGTAFWYLATFGFFLANFMHWFFNIYILTNERIVDIDFLYLLYKHFSVAELSKIQDLGYTEGGLLATVFDYGDVEVETAGEAPNIMFEAVPHPEKIVEVVRKLTEQAESPGGSSL